MHHKQKAYLVDWIDSVSDNSWQCGDEPREVARCQTLGYHVTEDKKCLTLALCRDVTGCNAPYGMTIVIPKVAIKRRRSIKIDY